MHKDNRRHESLQVKRRGDHRALNGNVREAVEEGVSLTNYPAYALLLALAFSVTLASSFLLHMG